MEDPDELIPCPFEPVHMLQRKRMPYHIIKCRKNQPQKHFRVCPFNHRHVVHHKELEAHLHTCPDQGIVEREITHRHNVASGIVPVQKGYTDTPVSSFRPPEPTEDWDSTHTVVEVGEFNTTQSSETESDSETSRTGQHGRGVTLERLVQKPPQPRIPNTGLMNDALQMVDDVTQPTATTPPKGRGLGRGRAFSPIKGDSSGGLALVGAPEIPRVVGVNSVALKRGSLGRGRMVFQTAMETDPARTEAPGGNGSFMEDAEFARKRERKLKKMQRQIVELEGKLARGEKLDEDQLAKVSRKQDVLHELALCQMEEPRLPCSHP